MLLDAVTAANAMQSNAALSTASVCSVRLSKPLLLLLLRLLCNFQLKGTITSKIKHAVKHKTSPGRYAVIGCKLKQNANEGCNSCASLAGLVLCFIACFILLVIAP